MDFKEPSQYGFNRIIKSYARFPWYLSLPAQFEHGWTPRNHPLPTDLKTKKPLMLVFSKRRKKEWEKESKIPAFIMGSPFIHYKNLKQIKSVPRPRGTVVFPAHSTFDLKTKYDVEEFCSKLKRLPKEFHPITICLFYLDFISEKAKLYRRHGFKIVTAGGKFAGSLSFAKNFYNILSQHKYAAANKVSSATFYAVDFGIPFFLIGKPAKLDISASRDVNIAHRAPGVDAKTGEYAAKIFSTGPVTCISPQQKKFVREEMGIGGELSREQMHKLLIKNANKSFLVSIAFVSWMGFKMMLLNGPWATLLVKIKYRLGR